MKIYLTISLFLFCNFLFAQYDVDVIGNQDITNTSGLWVINKKINNNIKGSYLLFEDSNNFGIISTNQGRRFKVPNLNYNVKQDQIEAKISNDSVFIFDPGKIDMVEIDNRLFKRYEDSNLFSECYLEIVGRSKEISLLKKYDVFVKEGVINPLTLQKQSPDTYIIKTKYFIFSHNALNEIRLKKGKLLKVFEEDSEKMDIYINENNLSIKEDEDLKLIFNYHYTL